MIQNYAAALNSKGKATASFHEIYIRELQGA